MANKPLHFVEHEIGDNIVLTNKKPDSLNITTVLLGADKVTVGVPSGKKGIKVDPVTGANYLGEIIDSQEVYNIHKQNHSNWFVLDLETGGRGWYPGSKQIVDVIVETAYIKSDADDSSETLAQVVNNDRLDVINDEIRNKVRWYVVKFNGIIGYIKASYVSVVKYVDRDA